MPNYIPKAFGISPFLLDYYILSFGIYSPVYAQLIDFELFQKAKISAATASWDNDIDIDPDRLYLESVLID
ncbi:MAG: DUF2442 domain-containing protein [Bacteroidota bacterium]|nr:DUF2442 domain-containing protein [Bacteroidota bacterium]